MARILRVALSPLGAGELDLEAGATRYVCRVHRLGVGDRFVAFDPERRTEADAELVQVTSRGARCRIGNLREAGLVSPLEITVLYALAKGEKVDLVVRAATTLGVRRVVAVETARSMLHLGERASSRAARWRAIAVDAARQSGRGDLPEIEGPIPLRMAVEKECGRSGRRLCLDVAAARPLRAAVRDWSASQAIACLIGPEGGLDGDEVRDACGCGFENVSLGPLTLRTETAAIALMGALVALSGWGGDGALPCPGGCGV